MKLIKTDAHGNDFLIVRAADVPAGTDLPALARRVCDRASARGADGLLIVEETPSGARMQLRNADGSYSEVSGNGVRCIGAWLAAARGTAPGGVLQVDTDAGPKVLTLISREGRRCTFRASMGEPTAIRKLCLDVAGEPVDLVTLSMGNPQCVVLGPVTEERLARLGSRLAVHPHFPEGTNVELAEVAVDGTLRILIWERGVGPTSSSGTGTCAAAVAAASFAGTARHIDVTAPGGTQHVEWHDDGVWLTGWAEVVEEFSV
jgi:diaminopimelate epimerase